MAMSFQAKIAAAATGGVAALTVGSAEARLVYVDDRPVALNALDIFVGAAPGVVNWDIDGVGGLEFRLVALSAEVSTVSFNFGLGTRWHSRFSVLLTNWYSWENIGGLVQKASSTNVRAHALAPGFQVGPTMANYDINSEKTVRGFFVHSSNRHMSRSFTCGTGIHYDPYCAPILVNNPGGYAFTERTYLGPAFRPEEGFQEGDNYVGFRFDDAVGAHYGWAVINLDYTRPWGVAITSWAYETTPETAVTVGELPTAIPAPPAVISGLTVLGLGAAGVRRMRKKRAQNQCEEELRN